MPTTFASLIFLIFSTSWASFFCSGVGVGCVELGELWQPAKTITREAAIAEKQIGFSGRMRIGMISFPFMGGTKKSEDGSQETEAKSPLSADSRLLISVSYFFNPHERSPRSAPGPS